MFRCSTLLFPSLSLLIYCIALLHQGGSANALSTTFRTADSAFVPSTKWTSTSPFWNKHPHHSGAEKRSRISDRKGGSSSLFASSGYVSKIICDFDTPTSWQEDLNASLKEFENYISMNNTFEEELLFSLNIADKRAKCDLRPELYDAFLLEVNGWPTTIQQYVKYLQWFASWIPQQNDYDGWLSKDGDYLSSHEEIYDRLCHFYYLINQRLPDNDDKTVQDNEWFAGWIVKFAQVWGKFCDSPESISPETIYSFWKYSKLFNVTDSMIPINEEDIPGNTNKFTIYNDQGKPLRPNTPSGWMSWNQIFGRRLNPGLRPIDAPTLNSVVCAPADCTFRASYTIDVENKFYDGEAINFSSYLNCIRG